MNIDECILNTPYGAGSLTDLSLTQSGPGLLEFSASGYIDILVTSMPWPQNKTKNKLLLTI